MKKYMLLFLGLFLFYSGTVIAKNTDEVLPRFASLRSGLINSRSGPSKKYPIQWVYTQKTAPVEILQEHMYEKEKWYKIRDWENDESWVHHTMISDNRYIKVVSPGENNLYDNPDYNSEVVAKVEAGVVGEIKKCPKQKQFCLAKFQNIEAWISKNDIFGIYNDEDIK